MTADELFADFGVAVRNLEGELSATDSDSFTRQFREICSCEPATKLNSIVYVWYTDKAIPRLRGESNVVYIGQTKQTFRGRHYRYAALEGSESNLERYRHIIRKFGPIKIMCAEVASPRQTEKEMLKRYWKEHLEFPPVNASG